jgi:hypothetical protein
LRIGRIVNRRAGVKPLNQAVRDAFLDAARGRGVAAGEVWEYVKWLRYYLDFCEKYRHEALDRDALQAFIGTWGNARSRSEKLLNGGLARDLRARRPEVQTSGVRLECCGRRDPARRRFLVHAPAKSGAALRLSPRDYSGSRPEAGGCLRVIGVLPDPALWARIRRC